MALLVLALHLPLKLSVDLFSPVAQIKAHLYVCINKCTYVYIHTNLP